MENDQARIMRGEALSPSMLYRDKTNGKLGLVSVILGTASGARNIGSSGALAIGGYIAVAGLWAAPISGASMNPVRSFAPDLIRGDLRTAWIYIVGPILGALIAVGFEWILKGKTTGAGDLAAQGHIE
jgi:aquaporin Z